MLFITPTSDARGAKDYFTRALSQPDYYVRDAQELAGQWHGLGAELLGLSGEVRQEDFFALCDNQNPVTGEQLTPRSKEGRRVLYDFTFDTPKAVSLAYEVGGDERILDVFRASVQETMVEMEADMQARVRTGGRDGDRRTANMVWGEFVHKTARPVDGVPDPQLHCHAVVFNATYDSVEERWKAAQFGNLVRDKIYYQAAFHARLAERLSDLGYGIERDGNSFTLAGIDRATINKFSRRTSLIEDEAERLGIHDAKRKGELGRRTREAKAEGESMGELREQWDAHLTDDERRALAQACDGKTNSTDDAKNAMDFALAHSFERASVVTEKKLVAEALMQGVGTASVQDVWQEAKRADILRKEAEGQRFVTTRDVYREELAMVGFAREGRGQHRKLGGTRAPELDPMLSQEQRDAALLILNSRDTVTGLKGGAGTGKTRMMQATVKAIEEGGKSVFAFAPSAKASRGVLRSEGFDSADTVERLLTDDKLRKEVHGQVLWIDEAGLLSIRDMKRVFDLARDEQCRVVLAGDSAQHGSVMRGDALRLLESEAGMKFAQLKTIRRQTQEDYREAVREISEGDARSRDGRTRLEVGVDRLDRMGAIVEAAGDDRYRQLAADYAEATAEDGYNKAKTALVVSPTHAEGQRTAAAIRMELKQQGRLGKTEREFSSLRPLNLTEAQRGQAGNYESGEIVRFHQNAKGGFGRGERFTVTQADARGVKIARADGSAAMLPLADAAKFQVYREEKLKLAAGDRLRITQNGFTREGMKAGKSVKSRLDNGDVFDVAGFTRGGDIRLANGFVVPKDYGGITQGYVVTSHASQGATVDKVLIALGSESLAAANRQQFYVSVSRGREAVKLYTDDKAGMLESVKADASRLTATELLKPKAAPPRKRPDSTSRLIGLQQIRRAYHAVRERVAAVGSFFHERNEVRLGGR